MGNMLQPAGKDSHELESRESIERFAWPRRDVLQAGALGVSVSIPLLLRRTYRAEPSR